jgi:type II secretory pathway pseudopilin PulG
MSKFNFITDDNGASLIEVLISMIILTFVFMGIMALSLSFINGNAMASRTNQATNIAQMQATQLQCIDAQNLEKSSYQSNISNGTPITYAVNQTQNGNVFNKDFAACAMPVSINGINDDYTVNVYLYPNQNTSSIINAKIEVSWNKNANVILLNSIVTDNV